MGGNQLGIDAVYASNTTTYPNDKLIAMSVAVVQEAVTSCYDTS